MAKSTKQRIVLFGGTFDPIHNGHLIVAGDVGRQFDADKIVLIPSSNPPHKENANITEAKHRLAMARLAVQDDNFFDVSDCEMCRSGPSYTLDTVRYFRDKYGPDAELYWLIGADTLGELAWWHRICELLSECTVVTAMRGGCQIDKAAWDKLAASSIQPEQITRLREHICQTPLIEISSSDIRRCVAMGLPIRCYVPQAIRDYIVTHSLYQ